MNPSTTAAPALETSLAYPLDEFYAQAGRPAPRLEAVEGEAVPQPYRSLLVHPDDMTSTLEKFHRSRIHLELLRTDRAGEFYFREVLLVLDDGGRAVEFGAIKINLALFDEASRERVLEGKIPLGRILNESGLKYTSSPKSFLRIEADAFMRDALKLTGSGALYGRRNTLSNERGESLAEIVEILPEEGEHFDALIIGGGPAGASTASILAGHGHRVLILEREKFPRYHVGESLLPFTFYPLRRLGLLEKMQKSAFQKKYSVQFVSPTGKASQPFYFNTRYPEDVATTWQVLRSEFDQMVLDHAREEGAQALEQMEVRELLRDADGRVIGVRAADRRNGGEKSFFAPITVDCSGKEAFGAVRNGWRIPDPFLKKVAVWTYYRGARRDAGIAEGTTTVAFVPEKGWFWYIPQHNNMVSVGVVAEGKYLTRDGVKAPREIFEREVGQNLWIKEYLSAGQQVGPHYVTNEFSFHSRHCAAPGLLLAGDALCFLDPVFSSGLMLAMKSGVSAADAIHEAILAGDFSPARFAEYGRVLREGIENMRKLVYAFYDPNFSFRKLTDRHPELAGDVTDCLSGDVNKDFSALWKAIREFAEIPGNLPYGTPLDAWETREAAGVERD